jgi:hypothetical protein
MSGSHFLKSHHQNTYISCFACTSDTLGDHLAMAFLVTKVVTILALVTRSSDQIISTKCALHKLVKLLRRKLVAVDNVKLSLSDSSVAM